MSKPSKAPRVRVGEISTRTLTPLRATLPIGNPCSKARKYKERRKVPWEPDIEGLIKKEFGVEFDEFPETIQAKVDSVIYQFAGQLIAGHHHLQFHTDKNGVAWLHFTVEQNELLVVILKWKLADLMSHTCSAHPDDNGGVTARALSDTFLAMHKALEREIGKVSQRLSR